MFILSRYQIHKATRNSNVFATSAISESDLYDQLRNCVIIHDEAIQFVFVT